MISLSDAIFFSLPLKLSQVLAGYALCSMFFSPCLTCSGQFKVSLLFFKCLVWPRQLYKADIKQNTNNIFLVVRFNIVTLILILPQTFLSPCWLRIMIYICFSLLRYAHKSQISSCFSQIFRFDSGSSIKLLSSKIEKMFLLSMVRFNPGRPYYHPCRFKTY